jgi:Na+/H+-translocating membrane pyrophosphatase
MAGDKHKEKAEAFTAMIIELVLLTVVLVFALHYFYCKILKLNQRGFHGLFFGLVLAATLCMIGACIYGIVKRDQIDHDNKESYYRRIWGFFAVFIFFIVACQTVFLTKYYVVTQKMKESIEGRDRWVTFRARFFQALVLGLELLATIGYLLNKDYIWLELLYTIPLFLLLIMICYIFH